jgi:dTDP-4-amino-4,6-dideoxygalactose transaminase
LFDIDPQTLQILPEELESPPSVLVLSNLYGLPDDVDARLVKCTLVIDDACQAMLSKRKGEYVGCWPGTLGVLSFGRGKALSGLGGGAIVAASLDATVSNAICSVLKELHSLDLSPEALGAGPRCYVSWAYALAYWMFGVPELYWIPAALPFLGLGETAADLDFSVDAPCPLRLAAAVSQLKKWGDYQKKRAETARKWNEVVADVGLSSPLVTRDLDLDGEVVPLRYPVICHDSKQREALFSVLSKAGLGVSKSYPMPVSGFEELRSSKLTVGRTAGAQIVADRILTLPVHGAVSDKDLVKAQRLFKRTLG